MNVCVECGFRNEPDERFCGGCGAFLEWSQEAGGEAGEVGGADDGEPYAQQPYADEAGETGDDEPYADEAGETDDGEPYAAEAGETGDDEPYVDEAGDDEAAPLEEPGNDGGVDVDETDNATADASSLEHQPEDGLLATAAVTTNGAHSSAAPATAPLAAATAPARSDGTPRSAGSPVPDTPAPGSGETRSEPELAVVPELDGPPADHETLTHAAPARASRRGVADAAAPARPAEQAAPAPAPTRRSVTTPGTAPVHPGAAPAKGGSPSGVKPGTKPVAAAGAAAGAAALVAPVRPTAAPTGRVAPVRPGRPRATPPPPPKPAADEPPPSPGDLVCGSCGAGNAPTRKFCRRCGASLVDAAVQGRRSWWSRLWRPEPKAAPKAGYRPNVRRLRFPTRGVVTLLVIGALVAVGFTFRPELESFALTVQDRVAGSDTINPVGVAASSAAPDHPADLVRDGTTNLSWQPEAPGDGVGQFLDFTFGEPFRLTRVLVMPGASDVEEEYLAQASPQELTVVVTTSAGTQQTFTMPLEDSVGLQNMPLAVDDVVAVRLQIAKTYRATPDTHVAIAEVEFRGRT
ncbi:zinc ribbon domain-containing protein [Miniimonas arenae]|uniref:Zinc ribbon domain-containing protein n=1 Tax=Miniimonas arenae TaxID=676201 RepID=A0A5C5B9B3_9MICO|nr:zinc ribbon domain-containing protein [Miniimonas arenae]TNU73291.1 zinc ribbon domain-containing protein [Miniimonas arenae]